MPQFPYPPDSASVRPKPLWSRDVGAADYHGTPLLVDGKLIGLDIKEHFNVIDVKTGDVLESRVLDPKFGGGGASPVLAAGRLYLTGSDSQVMVLDATPPYKVLAHNVLRNSPTRATLALQGTRAWLRTSDTLYCFGTR
jgi:hypothetical protein